METPRIQLLEADTTKAIIDSFRDVYRAFGFGYREFIYSRALERDLIAKGHCVARDVKVMVYYRGEPLALQVIDMVVNEKVIVENKATRRLDPPPRFNSSVICVRRISRWAYCSISDRGQIFIASSARID